MKRHLGNSCRFLDDVYSAGDFSGARSSLSWDCLACLSPFTLDIEAMGMAAMEAGGSRAATQFKTILCLHALLKWEDWSYCHMQF